MEEPPDGFQLGQASWAALHSIAHSFPQAPSSEDKRHVNNLFSSLSHLYPCTVCAEHLRSVLRFMPPRTESRDALTLWCCEVHNAVNRHIDKPEFDCALRWERWGGRKSPKTVQTTTTRVSTVVEASGGKVKVTTTVSRPS